MANAMFHVFWSLVILHVTCGTSWKEKDPDSRQLVYVQVVSIPGDFAPLELYPTSLNSEDDWPYGFGQPTKLGKKQEFELGKTLRKTYDHFITTDPSEVEVFSASEDRTVLAALSIMSSFYAPKPEWQFAPGLNWQPIPVAHDLAGDRFFYDEDFCSRMYNDRIAVVKSAPVQNLTSRNKVLYYYLSKKSEKEINNMFDVADLFNTLEKEKMAFLKVPSWSETFWEQMKMITNEAYGWKYNSTTSQMLKIGSLMDLIISRMRVKTPDYDPSPRTLVSVYITHDWNIAALLQTMGYLKGRPQPCTTLAFELYKQKQDLYVRVLLFNSTVPELGLQSPTVVKLEGCEEYCSVSTFGDFFRNVIPDDFRKECDSDEVILLEYPF